MRTGKALILLAAVAALVPGRAHADAYSSMAKRLGEMGAKHLSGTEKKLAILPFDYVDGRTSPGGRIVAENLIGNFVETGDYTVIERSQVEKLLGELKFQRTGVIDAATAKEIGRGLGVPAIVTGTMQSLPDGKVRINARMIKTETFEIVGSASREVDRTWSDQPGAEPEPAQPVYGGEARTPMAYGRRGGGGGGGGGTGGGFMDLFYGFGSDSMDLTFENQKVNQPIRGSELGFAGLTPLSLTSVSLAKLDSDGGSPMGIRFGGFGPVVGLGIELAWQSSSILAQAAKPTVASSIGSTIQSASVPADYLKVGVITIPAMDLLVKIPVSKSFFPYGGVGAGLTLNKIESAVITTWTEGTSSAGKAVLKPSSTPMDDLVPGYVLRFMGGVRAYFGNVGLFTEFRVTKDKFKFDRGIGSNEKDSVTLNTSALVGGLTFKFGP